eukprot:Nitzschia sp. Nitz4//scaffold22_size323478//66376//67161//NITZ4_000511-RA/size323478-processed-gene-0.450-mRNA-1//-1//CDS//3329542947//7165//frame0
MVSKPTDDSITKELYLNAGPDLQYKIDAIPRTSMPLLETLVIENEDHVDFPPVTLDIKMKHLKLLKLLWVPLAKVNLNRQKTGITGRPSNACKISVNLPELQMFLLTSYGNRKLDDWLHKLLRTSTKLKRFISDMIYVHNGDELMFRGKEREYICLQRANIQNTISLDTPNLKVLDLREAGPRVCVRVGTELTLEKEAHDEPVILVNLSRARFSQSTEAQFACFDRFSLYNHGTACNSDWDHVINPIGPLEEWDLKALLPN